MKRNEVDEIKLRYERRKSKKLDNNWKYSYFIQAEREYLYSQIIKVLPKPEDETSLLEIGAGTGGNLLFFHRLGIPFSNLYANELLEDRGRVLKENFPQNNVFIGDANELTFNEEFDIVFQSTVFTSILDDEFKQKLANKMWEMTKEDGIILWYDFKYNNPNNKDVKGIGRKEIVALFPKARRISFINVTLAPPIGRVIGKYYPIINFLFPFLRTHLIAVIKK